MTEAVKVMLRCRPMSLKEKQRNCRNVINTDSKLKQVSILKLNSKDQPRMFTFDYVFGPDSTQNLIYQQTAFSLVDSVIEGYNGTLFAYGQTGCGKTYTMMGSTQLQDTKGIIPRTFSQIITMTSSQKQKKHLVQCSFIEIYNQQIHDLLSKDIKAKMELKQSNQKGIFVKDLTMNIVKSISEMEKHMEIGFKNRVIRETAMNKESSRSHSIFTIYIESQQIDENGNSKFKAAKLNLVDLAGSQRLSKTQTTGDGVKEAAKINLSLSALGNVIYALVDGKAQHIPYRDSKLTRLLQDSLGGNTKTIMIAAISPADYNYQETLNTLRYASRAKYIQNKPIINQDPKDTLLRQYAQQIKNLKMMLEGKIPLNLNRQKSIIQENLNLVQFNKLQGNNLQIQLRSKLDLLRIQKQQKQNLKYQLENLQKIISKQDNQQNKKQLEKLKKLKQKLKQQKKKQQQYRNQKKKRQQELLSIQRNYKSLNQQVDQMRQRFQQLKNKYVANLSDLRDLREQHQRDKEELLDIIRAQQSENNKLNGILNMLLTQDQISQIVSQSQWIQDTRQWIIAPFYYRQKSVNFPKLPSYKFKQLLDAEKQKKQIVFRDVNRKESMLKSRQSLINNDLIYGSKDGNSSVQGNQLQKNSPLLKYQQRRSFKPATIQKSQSYDRFRIDDRLKIKLDPIQIKKDIVRQLNQNRKLQIRNT